MDRTEITGQVVKLDYSVLRDTNFRQCKLVYAGGRPPSMVNCDFVDCEFILEGPAQNTAMFLHTLVRAGAAELVIKGMLGVQGWEPSNV